MKTCVLGEGYIGSAYKEAGFPCVSKEDFCYTGDNFMELIPFIEEYDTIINCVGYTNTVTSEHPANFKEVWMTNAQFVKDLSDYCNLAKRWKKKKLVQISTGDLYGNVFDLDVNVEDNPNMDIGTNYRFSKYGGERFCHANDLILRIRLPFDGRNHPKNLLTKITKFKKFYCFSNDYTYLPDLINGSIALIDKKQSGIFNVVSSEDGCILFLLKNILGLTEFDNFDIHDEDHPDIIRELNNLHIHNISNDAKFKNWYPPTPLDLAVKTSWEQLQNACNPLIVS